MTDGMTIHDDAERLYEENATIRAALEEIAKGKCEGANLGLPCVSCEHTVARDALASLAKKGE